ncbi:C-terminal binding protein [Polycladidibacter stylochi]|uniref:C-terminal binding protein n=1 Tax=Polycladidibacter stylochi TaxID=1807766 RepID=UPI0008370A82|nr:C-terminal binding protein [Pseudovibrio stylochi]
MNKNNSPKVHILNHEHDDLSLERDIFSKAGYELVEAFGRDEELIEQVKDTRGLLHIYANIDATFVNALTQCKGVSRPGTGYETVDVNACRAKGIEVAHIPDYGDGEVATHAAALMLSLQQRVNEHASYTRAGIWDFKKVIAPRRMKNSVLGVIGYGRIGKEFVERMLPFVQKVIVVDPFAVKERLPDRVELGGLDDICEQAHMISLHCPLMPSTSHILNDAVFEKMQQKPILVNASRGGLIDTDALIRALDGDLLTAVALDVLEDEPNIPQSLKERQNVIITPHVGWFSASNIIEVRTRTAQNLVSMLRGETPDRPVPMQEG